MLPFGHSSMGYLIAQIPIDKKRVLKWYEVVFVMVCANLFDIDFLLPNLIGYPSGTHHLLATHTPLAGLIYFGLIWILLRKVLSKKAIILGGIALLSHLILDDFSYWLYLIGWEGSNPRPQIFWGFPFDPRRQVEIDRFFAIFNQRPYDNINFLVQNYFFKIPKLFYFEIVLTIMAGVTALKKRF